MGYEVFERRGELGKTLAYAVVRGLCENAQKPLLCDFSGGAKNYSGADLLAASCALAEVLRTESLGGRLGIAIPPSFIACVVNYACVLSGITPVNLNFTLGPVAAASCVATAKIREMITALPYSAKISKANPAFPWSQKVMDASQMLAQIPQERLDMWREAAAMGNPADILSHFGISENSTDPKKEGTLVFTSGSEGAPKAAILTERNIIANCLQTKLCGLFDSDDILLANLPIFHSFGLLFEVWYMAIEGQRTVSLASPLDIKSNVRAVKETGATAIIGSPTFFRAYIKHANAEDMATIRKAVAGAEKTPNGFHELWNSKFGDTYREGYGLTEATPVVGVNLPERDFGWYSTGARKGSIGKLFPGMSAKILDASTLKPLPFGMRGLLALKGANIFAGYLDNPEATNAALVDGWLVTGDLSRLDSDGFLYIDGRLSRFSKIGGEMVPHATVEAALNVQLGYAGSDVPSLAISSRLDEGKGEAIVLVAAVDITLAEAKEALRRAGISNLWMPKHLVRTDKIPLLPSGKLDLKKLAKLAAGD